MQEAIIAAAGLQLDCWATRTDGSPLNFATPGSTVRVHVRVANQGCDQKVHLQRLQASTGLQPTLARDPVIDPESVFETEFDVALGSTEPTRPSWSRDSIREPMYEVSGDSQQRPLPAHPLTVTAAAAVAGEVVDLISVVEVRQRHPQFGEVRYPLTIVPAMSVRFALPEGVVPLASSSYAVSVIVSGNVPGPADASVTLELPEGWTSEPATHSVALQREGDEISLSFSVAPPQNATTGVDELRATVTYQGREFHEGFQTVTARDLGRINLFRPAIHQVRRADIRLRGQPRVGYLMGSGDRVATALGNLGVHPQMLSEADLATGELGDYDLILVGVRAYAVRSDLRKFNARLLDYVHAGGVLIVQYQTPEFDQDFGPFPYQMGRNPEEVSEEDAAVTILQPGHPIFCLPNKITQDDFAGWFEQRGSKFWTSWDDRYTPLLECHDTGQPPQQGGMLIARYGKGVYVYSAYAWYRQLPQGVPGAYRLFANLLSLPETM